MMVPLLISRPRQSGKPEQRRARRAARAGDLHRGDAEAIAKRRMDRDDREVPGQRIGAIGFFGDGQPQQDRIGEQTAKPDGDAVFPIAFEDHPRADQSEYETDGCACVKTDQQARIKGRGQVNVGDGLKQKAGDREILRKPHQRISGIV